MTNNNLKTILIIEDDHAIRKDLEKLLRSEGYEVQLAENGQSALDLLNLGTKNPALVLLDIMMPVMDGWQFRSAQILDPKIASIPVVVMTADGHAPQKATKMKAQGYVQKPFDVDRLLRQVELNAV